MLEVEETLNRIKTHKGVSGIVIVNSEGVPMRSTLDSKQTLQYSALISQLAAKASVETKRKEFEEGIPLKREFTSEFLCKPIRLASSFEARSVVRELVRALARLLGYTAQDPQNDLTFLRRCNLVNEKTRSQ